MLGGELNNSSSSNLDSMTRIWKHMVNLNANTVVTPISWAQLEPQEGKYNFSLVDGLIKGARKYNLHLVFTWMASWKNGMSCYDPMWVKEDSKRFPLAQKADGTPTRVLSTFSSNNWKADAAAYAALMANIKKFDGTVHTVLMMQVENEVGILGEPRDMSPIADREFDGPVPARLISWMVAHSSHLVPELQDIWNKAGHLTAGTWEQVFGKGMQTDEIFMAWNYARYVNHVAAAGKAVYPIPMYANAWLDGNGAKPGDYPSGCPEAHVMDIWQAGAPHINLLGPDLYAGNFRTRCRLYTRRHNVLFMPEMNSDAGGARNIFYAIGRHNAIGVSPFGIDHTPSNGPFHTSYGLLEQIAPLLLQKEQTGSVVGFVLDTSHPDYDYRMGNYEVHVSLDSIFGHTTNQGFGIVIQTGANRFLGAGSGFRVMFTPLTPGPKYAGIGTVVQGNFLNSKWVPGLTLNGDQTDQGRSWRFASYEHSIETCHVYRYD